MKKIYLGSGLFTLIFFLLLRIFLTDANADKNSVLLSPYVATLTPSNNYTENESVQKVKEINNTSILILGLDARKGDGKPRCDAIHLINIRKKENVVEIINIPRGTPVILEDGLETYISNACHYEGTDKTKKRIREISGINEDYTVKIGFSQTQGILRSLKLNPIQTLQFLRTRKIYGIGDNQRTHNQGMFIKDLLTSKLNFVTSLPKPAIYLLYKFADTDMDFETAFNILETVRDMNVVNEPEKIIVTTKSPSLKLIKDTKYQNLIDQVPEGTKDEEYTKYQENLKYYIDNLLKNSNSYAESGNVKKAFSLLSVPYSQKIWLQIDNEQERDMTQFKFFEIMAKYNLYENISSDILDFAEKMEIEGKNDLYNKAKNLLINP